MHAPGAPSSRHVQQGFDDACEELKTKILRYLKAVGDGHARAPPEDHEWRRRQRPTSPSGSGAAKANNLKDDGHLQESCRPDEEDLRCDIRISRRGCEADEPQGHRGAAVVRQHGLFLTECSNSLSWAGNGNGKHNHNDKTQDQNHHANLNNTLLETAQDTNCDIFADATSRKVGNYSEQEQLLTQHNREQLLTHQSPRSAVDMLESESDEVVVQGTDYNGNDHSRNQVQNLEVENQDHSHPQSQSRGAGAATSSKNTPGISSEKRLCEEKENTACGTSGTNSGGCATDPALDVRSLLEEIDAVREGLQRTGA